MDNDQSPDQPAAPKRDKFAAMASRQQDGAAAVAAPSPPKRDKLAALAARQSESSPPVNEEYSMPVTVAVSTQSAPKRDKFAAMEQAAPSAPTTTQLRRDKFASMSSRPVAKSADNEQEETIHQKQQQQQQREHRQKLRERCEQRSDVWKDSERAQAWTIRLLDIAQETTQVLGRGDIISTSSNSDNSSSYDRLSALSSRYLDTLKNLHSCLEPHAHFVKAYTDQPPPDEKNSSLSQQKNRMYTSRVDLRIAKSRKALLQDILEIEQQEEQGHKRPTNGGDQNRKRKREEGV